MTTKHPAHVMKANLCISGFSQLRSKSISIHYAMIMFRQTKGVMLITSQSWVKGSNPRSLFSWRGMKRLPTPYWPSGGRLKAQQLRRYLPSSPDVIIPDVGQTRTPYSRPPWPLRRDHASSSQDILSMPSWNNMRSNSLSSCSFKVNRSEDAKKGELKSTKKKEKQELGQHGHQIAR